MWTTLLILYSGGKPEAFEWPRRPTMAPFSGAASEGQQGLLPEHPRLMPPVCQPRLDDRKTTSPLIGMTMPWTSAMGRPSLVRRDIACRRLKGGSGKLPCWKALGALLPELLMGPRPTMSSVPPANGVL